MAEAHQRGKLPVAGSTESTMQGGKSSSLSALYLFTMRLGLRWFLRGIDYWRCYEYPKAITLLDLYNGLRVLDIGSASYSILPLYLAAQKKFMLHITDCDPCVYFHRKTLVDMGCDESLADGFLEVAVQDARHLDYPDNWFDRVCAISTVEHIPGDGDVIAMREVGRVLKPTGIAFLTVPMAWQFHEEFLDEGLIKGYGVNCNFLDLFSRKRTGRLVFFQRRYDLDALKERLVGPSGLQVRDIFYFGEPYCSVSKVWSRRHPLVKLFSNWLNPMLSAMFVRTMQSPSADGVEGAVLVLSK